jgi:3-oxoacyl-[acyl-carrier-protein] synthase-3
MNPTGFRITGTGIHLPSRILTNADLEKMVDTTDEWIVTRTGIRERRLAAPGEMTSDMAAAAARQALAEASLDPADLDLILVATVTPDSFFPATACYVQDKIGATRAAAFDLQAACSGFLYSLVVANQFIRSGAYKNILLIGAERLSSIVDWKDRNTCVLFGDGAGAVVLQADPAARGILTWNLGASGAHSHLLHLKNPTCLGSVGSPLERIEPTYLYMSGKEVFKQAVNAMADSAAGVLADSGVGVGDLRAVISHQANVRIIDALADKLKVPADKCFVNVHKYGNMSAACIPIALHEAKTHYGLQPGDKLLLVAFGGGLTWASTLLEW